jgi:hypothetical protein
MVYGNPKTFWFNEQQDAFRAWLINNNIDANDANLSLGHLPIGYVDFESSFGTTDMAKIWEILSNHLDIYSIKVDDVQQVYDYCWSDKNYKQLQIDMMKPGYDYNSRR